MINTGHVGRRAEDRAADHLVARGYSIVARNWRCKVGELDLIARDGDVLAFVEVRSRASATRGDALHAVNPHKQHRVARVASAYLAAHNPRARACRFDVVAITGDDVVLIKDAFRLS